MASLRGRGRGRGGGGDSSPKYVPHMCSVVLRLIIRRGAWRGGAPNGNGNQNQNARANMTTISGPPGGPRTSIHDQYIYPLSHPQ
jgi:hypothetical protein